MFNISSMIIEAEHHQKEYMREASQRRLVRDARKPAPRLVLKAALPGFLRIQPKETQRAAVAAHRAEVC